MTSKDLVREGDVCPECCDGVAVSKEDGYLQCSCCGVRWDASGQQVAVGDALAT